MKTEQKTARPSLPHALFSLSGGVRKGARHIKARWPTGKKNLAPAGVCFAFSDFFERRLYGTRKYFHAGDYAGRRIRGQAIPARLPIQPRAF